MTCILACIRFRIVCRQEAFIIHRKSSKQYIGWFHHASLEKKSRPDNMTNNLEYRLVNGYIHNWLVAGTRALPINNVKHHSGKEDDRLQRVYQSLPKDQREKTIDLNIDPLEMVGFEVDGYKSDLALQALYG